MDPINLLQRAVDQTGGIVAGVKNDQMSASTPCDDWDVHTLVNHTITVVGMFNDSAQGKPINAAAFATDQVGDDPGASYEAAATALRETLAQPGVIDRTWTMPFGEVPGQMGAAFATLELTQHGWDVARATGQDPAFDPEITEAAMASARMAPAELVRTPGVFGVDVPCDSSAPAHDQLAAFLGRSV
jgi:uncharacterized protein (TIGR03086 family)